MFPRLLPIISAALLMLASCRPKPIEIEIPQKPGTLAISSACYNGNTVYVSAGYTITSLKKLLDTASVKELAGVPDDMLIDSALVTIRGYGEEPDTLRKVSSGLYSRKDLNLVPGKEYSLLVVDYRKGTKATAVTTYYPEPTIDTIYPEHIQDANGGTSIRLKLRLRDVMPGSTYCVSYNTPQHMRETATPLPHNAGALYSFAPKHLELFGADADASGTLQRTVTLQVAPSDTVYIQVGRIDKPYFNYLAAYKRTGALINQLTGEPINLPSNIVTGFGFFSLYQPVRRVFDLNKH